jgi:hypothetical protein
MHHEYYSWPGTKLKYLASSHILDHKLITFVLLFNKSSNVKELLRGFKTKKAASGGLPKLSAHCLWDQTFSIF